MVRCQDVDLSEGGRRYGLLCLALALGRRWLVCKVYSVTSRRGWKGFVLCTP